MRRFPLDVLLVNDDPHNYAPVEDCHRYLHSHPAVRSYGIASTGKALSYVREGKVNTLLVSPGLSDSRSLKNMTDFIARVEAEYPRIVVVIYSWNVVKLVEDVPELKSYFKLDARELRRDRVGESNAAEMLLSKCERWHETRFDYDFAFSFAGEDRPEAERLADALKKAGVRVFYDQYEQVSLVGRDLFVHLYEVYATRSRYCVLMSSERYVEKMWTIHERRAAQERTLHERGADYIIPIRLDNAEIPGVPSTIGYLSYAAGPQAIADTLVKKLWLIEPTTEKRYIGYSLYDYDSTPLMRMVSRANYHQTTSLYVPPSWEYELIRDKEEADKAALSAAREEMKTALRVHFREFVTRLESRTDVGIDRILPGLTTDEINARERELGILLPNTYKQFLSTSAGFWLFDGAVQFSGNHPYRLTFPSYESLNDDDKKIVASNGGLWPPPSDGMICFGEYFEGDVGCSLMFDTNDKMKDGEYKISHYYFRASPPRAELVADSFLEWLDRKCFGGFKRDQAH